MNLKLPGGCVLLNQKVEQIYETLEGILKINGAKGRRKYVRLDCDEKKYISFIQKESNTATMYFGNKSQEFLSQKGIYQEP